MFDKYHVGPSSVSVHETRTVNEHRAPTDESVRLLSEMEEKALRRVIFSEKTASNELQIFVLVLRPSFETGDHEFRYAFTLNGKPIDGRVKVGYSEWAVMMGKKAAVMQFVRERVASDIARAILAKFPVEVGEVKSP